MQFKAKLDDLPNMLDFIKASSKKAGLKDKDIFRLELASEEAIVNVISYAYPKEDNESLSAVIDIECAFFSQHCEIHIKDRGLPFNPVDVPVKVEKDKPVVDRPIGGLGIYLIRHLMDEISYQRDNNQNILKLVLRHQ